MATLTCRGSLFVLRQTLKKSFSSPSTSCMVLPSLHRLPLSTSCCLPTPKSTKKSKTAVPIVVDTTQVNLYNKKEAKLWLAELSIEERKNLAKALQVKLPPAEEVAAVAEEVANEDERPPTANELYHLAFHQALPFIGFGFLDNFIMILAGDWIDHHIGITFGISTMAAAALGNTISDLFGVGSAWYVEHFAARLGAKPPELTHVQLATTPARIAANAGRAGGVALGCIIGMAPLFFM